MSSSLIYTMTADTWKNLKEAAGVKNTAWYSSGKVSVASKLAAWQSARVKAKAVRKEVEKITYKFEADDGEVLAKALKALNELKTALEGMQTKAKAHKPKGNDESAALTAFLMKITAMITEATTKTTKWKAAYDAWKTQNRSNLTKLLEVVGL